MCVCIEHTFEISVISEGVFIIWCVLGGMDSSRGGEFKKPETLFCLAPGYSCTDRLSHYLNIRMNISVVLEELSAHLLVCSCIGVYATCARAGIRLTVLVCVCVCVCVLEVVCGRLPWGRSFTAISCPHKVTVCLLSPALICPISTR